MPGSDDISVLQVVRIESELHGSLSTTPITSMRHLAQIYGCLHNLDYDQAASLPPSQITSWWREYSAALSHPCSEDVDIGVHAPDVAQITMLDLVNLEDALGSPLLGGGVDYDLLANQLVCVQHLGRYTPADMQIIHGMPYPAYYTRIWIPVRTALITALTPGGASASSSESPSGEGEDSPTKNPYGA